MFKEMRRIIKLVLVSIVASIAMFVACKDDDSDSSSLPVIDQTEFDIPAYGGMSVIRINSDKKWNISVDNPEWVKITDETDAVEITEIKGPGVVRVNVESLPVNSKGYPVGERRNAIITFSDESTSEKVYIQQRGFQEDTNYKTGEVLKLWTHTKGDGIRVIIICDGFDRHDCEYGGLLEDMCVKLENMFLSMPIIRDFKEYFDVWARVDVSRERGSRNCVLTPNDCPPNAYGSGHSDLDWNKIYVNAAEAAEGKDRSIIFMSNGMIGGAAYGDLAVYSAADPENGYWMIHEFAGHVIGRFPDLYAASHGTGKSSPAFRAMLDSNHAIGELCMLDWQTDSTKVFWKDFIKRPGYSRVGIYPTGYYSVKHGEVYTCEPTFYSAMDDRNMYYTVMERYQLWRQIQVRAGITSNPKMDDFIEYDKININRRADSPFSCFEGNPLWGNTEEDIKVQWTTDPRIWSSDN
jgi:hypothetical protein